jgi:hypothetical protein
MHAHILHMSIFYVSSGTLTLIENMTLGIGTIFLLTQHTMTSQPEGLGYIFIAAGQPSIC